MRKTETPMHDHVNSYIEVIDQTKEALDEAINTHIYDAQSGEVPPADCSFLKLRNKVALTADLARRLGAFTHLEMEAALCIWEWINDVTLSDTDQKIDVWATYREGVGCMELRSASSNIYAGWLLKVYDICQTAGEPFDCMSYDWDVVPLIMEHCLHDGHPAASGDTLPDPRATAITVLAKIAKQRWYEDARKAAKHHWSYEELVDDFEEVIEKARLDGEMPEKVILEIGEQYDLDSPDPISAAARPPMFLMFKPSDYLLPEQA